MSSCILYQSKEKTTFLLDIPRSIELAQGTSEEPCPRRLLSCKPLEAPFPSLEPKSAKAKANLGEIPIKTLLLQKHIQFSLEQIKSQHLGPWHLPRIITSENGSGTEGPPPKKQKTQSSDQCPENDPDIYSEDKSISIKVLPIYGIPQFHQNQNLKTTILKYINTSKTIFIYTPPNSTFVNSFITTPESFQLPNDNKFPTSKFDLILLDPPWPNRSVRRKHNYSISSTTTEIQSLLTSIPIPSILAPNGIVALWITNKTVFHNLILESDSGIFRQWGLELIEEWVWVKITKDGDPMCAIDGSWRKPYEMLLIARKIPTNDDEHANSALEEKIYDIKRRVIFAVPDVHSRKPNLKEIFEISGLLSNSVKYEALEIFARNMTADWWSWGNEVVEFQNEKYWVQPNQNSKVIAIDVQK